MDVDEVFGNQMGAAYVMRERMRDLYVIRRVSFCWPQVVPARARRILRRGVARDMMDEMWDEKLRWVLFICNEYQRLAKSVCE